MQKSISNKIQLGQTINPIRDYGGVDSVDDDRNLKSLFSIIDKVGALWKTGKADGDLARYLPNILPVTRQNQLSGGLPRKAYASETYSYKRSLEFVLELTAGTYTNYSSMEIALPVYFTKKASALTQMDATMITVNNFFAHWFTDIDIRRYPDDMKILPTNNSVDIYQYANSQLKHLPEKSAETLLKPFLYSNKPVYLDEDVDRRDFDDNTSTKRSDPNLTYRLAQLAAYFFAKIEYRIPLGLLTDLGLCNFPVQTNTKITITLETDTSRLFESNKKVTALPTISPNAVIRFHDRLYISYQELSLTAVYETYLKTILRSEASLRTDVLSAPFQQLFVINTSAQADTVTFKGAEDSLIG